ncbi:MAG: RDD family protein [Balneolaceae bacterium]|nr:RDD family protein [Balneolaceae bacterium]
MVGIETSQHVKLSYEPAGIGERVLAYLLDVFFLGVYYFVVLWIMGIVMESAGLGAIARLPNWAPIVFIVLPVMLYHLICEVVWKGYSIGKKIMGIRVVKVDGTRADLSGYLVRWLFRLLEITMTSGVVAFITVLLNGKGQRLGDIVGKTCVIKERKSVKLDNTLFAEIEEEYEPVFTQVAELSDKDVRIIREVLDSRSTYDRNTWFVMLQRSRKLVEEKLGINRADMQADEFLRTIIRDYNAIHGR